MAAISLEQALELARSYHLAGQLSAAEAMCRQVLAAQPGNPVALHRLGSLAYVHGRYEEALDLMQKAVAQSPTSAEYHSNLGLTYRNLGRLQEASASLHRALELNPNLPFAHMNLGEVFFVAGEASEAIARYQRALELLPNYVEAENNLGSALATLGRHEESRQHLERALALKPDYAEALSNLGHTLLELNQVDESIDCCRRALRLKPHLAATHANLGGALLCQGLFTAALDSYRQAVALRSDFAEARETLGFILLLLGRFEEGWKEHEWRWQNLAWTSRWEHIPAPRWDGTPIPGRTLWLPAEQGYGDTLQLVRYLPLLRARAGAARVVLVCPSALGRLLSPTDGWEVKSVQHDTWDAADVSPSDRFLPLLSLPAVLAQYEPLPMTQPYIRAEPHSCTVWQSRLASASGLKVGLIWAGGSSHRRDAQRSLTFEQVAPLLDLPGVTFVSAQFGNPNAGGTQSRINLIDYSAAIADFADTAALFAELDLIITVDTAAAHLAGAMCRPAWTLLPFLPDWRWGLEREDTPWYPTMRLFRQKNAGDWDDVIQRVAEELRALSPQPN